MRAPPWVSPVAALAVDFEPSKKRHSIALRTKALGVLPAVRSPIAGFESTVR
jgi:hypothetical protein